MRKEIIEAIELLEKLADKNKWEKNRGGYWVYSEISPFVIADQALTALTKLREAPEQPPVGEFTKDFRKLIEHPLTTLKLKRWHTKSKEACGIIDQLQASLDSAEASKVELLKAIAGSRPTTIAKAKKEG